ncbi:MAG TPA: diaminopimelate decarboxylase [Candidatus Hydrogenedentes bacterium]|nr:diaminopimelate decarboxylase [Candidatus Hydrogenedentota bacterium]
MMLMEKLRFLNEKQVLAVCREFGTPAFVYDQATLERRASEVLAFPNAFGLTARYAMKASPNAAIIRTFNRMGLHIDASSAYEVERALRAGVPPEHIQLTAQELPGNLQEIVDRGVCFNACSLHQLRVFGQYYPGRDVSVRINPGLGSGHSNRTNVGGPSASFGIWHEHLDQVFAVAQEFGLHITGMHTHIGSGTDPDIWVYCAQLSLGIAARMPEVTRLSLGGGFKVARMQNEVSADFQTIGEKIKTEFESFAHQHGRKLHLEVEPGTYLVANAGALVCRVMDIVDTGEKGYTFIKVDSGMTEILRPSLYGAQHPIIVVPQVRERRKSAKYLVVGHCCESGDILTPKPGNPEQLKPRVLKEARIGDALVIEGAGAYCAAMSSKNYNSFPECGEVLLTHAGKLVLVRRRQTLDQVLQNECSEEAV